MPLFPDMSEEAVYISMNDKNELLSRNSNHPIELEDKEWPTVEHYFQAMRFESESYQEKIRLSSDVSQVEKLGKSWTKKKRPDLKKVQTTLMTRALYIKCRTYEDVATRLLETGDIKLIENSQFDYYWGCGRDHRGDNHYGKVLMNVRDKLNSLNNADE